jgi:hypothetical protein
MPELIEISDKWSGVTALFTGLLVIAAIAGGYIAYRNIRVLREQHRWNTFLNLINEISNERARYNRALIHSIIQPDSIWPPPEEIPKNMVFSHPSLRGTGSEDLEAAVQETIVSFDKVGFSCYEATQT